MTTEFGHIPKVSNQFDNPTLQIATQKLNDHIFLEWSRSTKLFLLSQGKDEPEVAKPFLFLSTAKEIWDVVTHNYSKQEDAAQVLWHEVDIYQHIEMESPKDVAKLADLLERQRIFEFLASLNPELDQVLWHKVDIYQHIEMESPKDVAKLADLLERQRIFEFLAGLNPELDQDLSSRKMIVSAKERNGLYYLDTEEGGKV
uniref:Retrotransposon Copia-like N-terminal domain-containing protein n=1 Tax=Vitis vinifera TaxID=29760 RepID=A5B7T8_VITVI|nr:hypothetical protein VITISV_004592 [Vitis vinifera]